MVSSRQPLGMQESAHHILNLQHRSYHIHEGVAIILGIDQPDSSVGTHYEPTSLEYNGRMERHDEHKLHVQSPVKLVIIFACWLTGKRAAF
jgi:hypothetical protein